MSKVKFLIGMLFVSMTLTALTACDVVDDPVVPTTTDVDDPQEEVTDQPANARQN